MTITIKVDPTHPWNNPADPAYRPNFQYVCQDSNGQNSWSFTYIPVSRYWNAGNVGGRNYWPTGKPGHLIVSAVQELNYADLDVQQWNAPLKAQIAYFVAKGYIIVDDGSGAMTPDEIRALVPPCCVP